MTSNQTLVVRTAVVGLAGVAIVKAHSKIQDTLLERKIADMQRRTDTALKTMKLISR